MPYPIFHPTHFRLTQPGRTGATSPGPMHVAHTHRHAHACSYDSFCSSAWRSLVHGLAVPSIICHASICQPIHHIPAYTNHPYFPCFHPVLRTRPCNSRHLSILHACFYVSAFHSLASIFPCTTMIITLHITPDFVSAFGSSVLGHAYLLPSLTQNKYYERS
jgi:hypothetical protein